MSNHLEQLIAEWYEYQGYFVRRNVQVGKRSAGGYECELDVVAFHPQKKRLVHIEPSTDAESWDQREKRYEKKFEAGRSHIPKLFEGLDVPAQIDQVAVFIYASKSKHEKIAGGTVMTVKDVLQEILIAMRDMPIGKRAVPEQFPILRTMQLVNEYRNELWAS